MTEFIGTFFLVFTIGMCVIEPGDIKVVPALICELIGTFALAYVVLNVATAKATEGNSHYGVAIGMTFMHVAKASNLWIYLLANLTAGALAAATFCWINPDDR